MPRRRGQRHFPGAQPDRLPPPGPAGRQPSDQSWDRGAFAARTTSVLQQPLPPQGGPFTRNPPRPGRPLRTGEAGRMRVARGLRREKGAESLTSPPPGLGQGARAGLAASGLRQIEPDKAGKFSFPRGRGRAPGSDRPRDAKAETSQGLRL